MKMTEPSTDHSRDTSPARRELLIAAALALALLLLPIAVPPLRLLFFKPLWLDELHTWLLARDFAGPNLVQQLAQGADFNPPLLFVIDAAMLRLLPGVPPQVTLRLTSVIGTWVAMFLLYRVARERLAVLPAAVGAIAVLASSIFVGQLHEARFYAPWFGLTVALAWAMQRALDQPRSIGRHLSVALLTAATCLIHYYGVISVFCLGLGLIILIRSPARLWRVALATALGVVALAAWMPVYAAQRSVLHIATWVPAPTPRSSVMFLLLFFAWIPYLLVILAAAGTRWLQRGRSAPLGALTPAQAALIALLAMPPILVVVSYLVQPTLLGRYAIPAIAGMATIVAIATAVLPRRLQQLALVGMLASYGAVLAWKARVAKRFVAEAYAGLAAVNRVAGDGRLVVSLERASMYSASLSAASRNENLAYLVMPLDTIASQLTSQPNDGLYRITAVEQDATIAHNRVFRLSTPDRARLAAAPAVVLLPPLPGGEHSGDAGAVQRLSRLPSRSASASLHRQSRHRADRRVVVARVALPARAIVTRAVRPVMLCARAPR